MTMLEKISTAYRLNARLYNLAAAYVLAALILRFPWLLNWLPQTQQPLIFDLADTVTKFALGLAILWTKDKLISGNGSADKPFVKPDEPKP
jgi:hypothetical protein